jgi:plasmid replication initiation protein
MSGTCMVCDKNIKDFFRSSNLFFGITTFSFTIVETCAKSKLKVDEDRYSNLYKPLLNILKNSYTQAELNKISKLAKLKI